MTKLIYCATPSRIANKTKEIMDFVSLQGYAPLHPFQALPYERFEGNPVIGREKSIEYCLRLLDNCDELWMFGISEGTLDEVTHALSIIPVRLHLNFDLQWRKYYSEFREKYNGILDELIENI